MVELLLAAWVVVVGEPGRFKLVPICPLVMVPVRSPKAGWAYPITPAELIELANWCVDAVEGTTELELASGRVNVLAAVVVAETISLLSVVAPPT